MMLASPDSQTSSWPVSQFVALVLLVATLTGFALRHPALPSRSRSTYNRRNGMPVATRKIETEKHDLKTLPGAWVELRQLSYDEMLERRDGATQILMERGIKNTDSQQMNVKVLNRWSNQYSFPRCIVDHNLTDEQNIPLDFNKP